jgi:hypothetical protein
VRRDAAERHVVLARCGEWSCRCGRLRGVGMTGLRGHEGFGTPEVLTHRRCMDTLQPAVSKFL